MSNKTLSSTFRWKDAQSRFLMKFLLDQIKEGQKTDKGFKSSALTKAAKAVSNEFQVKCEVYNVTNHLRTLRSKWNIIEKIKALSGATIAWDKCQVNLAEETAREYVMAHNEAEAYINKPIENFEQMALLFANESATGEFCKDSGRYGGPLGEEDPLLSGSSSNFNGGVRNQSHLEHDFGNDHEGVEVVSAHQQPRPDNSESSQGRSKGKGMKRSRVEDDCFTIELAKNIGRLAEAIEKAGDKVAVVTMKGKLDEERLMNEVVRVGGIKYNKGTLLDMVSHLMSNEAQAKTFLAADDEMRTIMMDRFLSSRSLS